MKSKPKPKFPPLSPGSSLAAFLESAFWHKGMFAHAFLKGARDRTVLAARTGTKPENPYAGGADTAPTGRGRTVPTWRRGLAKAWEDGFRTADVACTRAIARVHGRGRKSTRAAARVHKKGGRS